MIASEDYFYTMDRLRLYYQHWLPDTIQAPRGLVIIVHGLGEHSHRYRNVIDEVVAQRVGVSTFDLRGHGRSEGRRGHIYFFRQYLQDLDQFIKLSKALHPDPCRVFLLGHSLGGLIVLRYCLQKTQFLSGVIVSGPALAVKIKLPEYKKFFAKTFSALFPTIRFQNEVHPQLLSRDYKIVENYLSDPLVHHEATARFYTETLRSMEEVRRNIAHFRLPTLFLQGENDHLIDPEVTVQVFNEIQYADKTLKLYTGSLHEVFNDLDKELVINDLCRWIRQHL